MVLCINISMYCIDYVKLLTRLLGHPCGSTSFKAKKTQKMYTRTGSIEELEELGEGVSNWIYSVVYKYAYFDAVITKLCVL